MILKNSPVIPSFTYISTLKIQDQSNIINKLEMYKGGN